MVNKKNRSISGIAQITLLIIIAFFILIGISIWVLIKNKEKKNTEPYLPGDNFEYVAGTSLENGLVIRDENGNEYVWIEVPKSIYSNNEYNTDKKTSDKKPKKSSDYEKIEYCLKKYTKAYRNHLYNDEYEDDSTEGWFKSEKEYNEAKNYMLKSIYENGGFYIGRYEAGIDSFRKSKDEEIVDIPVSQPNKFPYAYVTRTQAKNLAEMVESGNCKSSLMFGLQWDLVLAFIQHNGGVSRYELTRRSTNLGNYKNNIWNVQNDEAKYYDYKTEWKSCPYEKNSVEEILLTTGASPEFAQMNIYDISGNEWEWTLERNKNTLTDTTEDLNARLEEEKKSYPCVARGGSCGSDATVIATNFRSGHNDIMYSSSAATFRVTLYK